MINNAGNLSSHTGSRAFHRYGSMTGHGLVALCIRAAHGRCQQTLLPGGCQVCR